MYYQRVNYSFLVHNQWFNSTSMVLEWVRRKRYNAESSGEKEKINNEARVLYNNS